MGYAHATLIKRILNLPTCIGGPWLSGGTLASLVAGDGSLLPLAGSGGAVS